MQSRSAVFTQPLCDFKQNYFYRYYFSKEEPNGNIGFHNKFDDIRFQRKIESQVLVHIVIYEIETITKICNVHRM